MFGVRARAWVLSLVAFVGAALAGISVPDVAQAAWTPQAGTDGWCTIIPGSTWACYATPIQACKRQHQEFAPQTVFTGTQESGDSTIKYCTWKWGFGDVQPSHVSIRCNLGFVPNAFGFCAPEGGDFQSRPDNCGTSNVRVGNPIELLNGIKRFYKDDFTSADGGLSLARTFVSHRGSAMLARYAAETPKGLANWLYDFQYEIQIPSTFDGFQRISLFAPDGGAYAFAKNSAGALVSVDAQNNPQTNYTLALVGTWPSNPRTAKTYWKMVDDQDGVWLFETFLDAAVGAYQTARPTSHTTREGLVQTFSYSTDGVLNQVQDNRGKTITFTWIGTTLEGERAISQANLPGGNRIEYVYGAVEGNSPERLLSATLKDSAGNVLDKTSYDYDNETFTNYVTGVRDRNNVLRWTATYDANGRGTSSSGPGGVDAVTVAYGGNGATFTRTVTNALGKVAVYNYSKGWQVSEDIRFNGVTGVASTNCPSSASSTTYGSDRLISSATDEEGRVTKYTWDSRGQGLQTIEGFGTPQARTTTRTWDPTFHVPATIVEPKATTSFTYFTNGALKTRTVTDTTTYTAPYATNGRTRTWTYAWTSSGQLQSIDGPLAGTGDTQSWTFNSSGYLATATNELGQVTTVTAWNWRGQPTTMVDANSVTTNLAYDVQGRLTSSTINPGAAQSQYQFEYSAMGDLTKITLPLGGYLQYTYDNARRLTLVTNDRGETVTLTPNLMGQATAAVTKTAGATITAQQSRTYDELGRLIQVIGAGSQTTGLGYDKTDNQKTLTDARGKTFTMGYDALSRVISQTNPESQTVQRAYDAADVLTSHKDGRAIETTQIVDGFGQVIQETSPDRGVRKYWYDAAGNLTKIIDGDAEETNITYDAASRRTGMTFPGATGETVTFAYDAVAGGNKGVGRLTSVSEESGSSVYTYDAQGRVTQDAKSIQGLNYTVGYAYDANGKVTQITLPSGRIVSLTRASDGLVSAVSTKPSASGTVQNLATSVAYQPFGPLKSLTYGNGLALTRSYDQNYWLTGTSVAATGVTRLNLTFGRNPNGQLSGVTDNAATGRDADFGYTDSGRLQYGVGPWGDQGYGYDASGNRTDYQSTVGGVTKYEYQGNSGNDNQTTYVVNANGDPLRSLSYRDGGDLHQDARVGGSTYQYYYNARKRLVAVNKDAADQAYYAYDYRGQRVARSVLVPTWSATHYIFDLQGHLIAEHNGDTGAVIKQYIWLDDTPLAVLDKSSGTEKLYYIHTGQLEEPLMMTDASKAKVWDGYVEPFGKAQVFGTATASLDLRLPGQWAQLESGGLSQNWHRDYDPSLGRYVQGDPIGLDGGDNAYAYVDGRVLEWIDVFGLQSSVFVWRPVGKGSSSFGHVSVSIRGWTFSWNHDSNFLIQRTSDYLKAQRFRDGEEYMLNLSDKDEEKFLQCMKSYPIKPYNLFTNNCGTAIQRCLNVVDKSMGTSVMPIDIRQNLRSRPNTPKVDHPQSKPGDGWNAPWTQWPK